MSTLEQRNAETVRTFIEALWNKGELEVAGPFFAPSIGEAFTDRSYELGDMLAQGEKVTATGIR
ncbi:hypothetical protein [Paenibacillus flagellatus]|uniref:Uncharacterized protein n=1 Tax=Paenibacillus flagellatus TaxID=2211139 RepID=A0A2V5KN63_9BACL|nr:hypothetical protein [Paenibacillus flagellatus]PYI52477.1 hypothetical protein DLM86_20055 [Paenibacillus flagellatus]